MDETVGEGDLPGLGTTGSRIHRLASGPRFLADRLRTLGPRGLGLGAFLPYMLGSLALWGFAFLGRFSTAYASVGKTDAKLYAWALRWWPYALAHGLNPFISRVVWAPAGVNLAWVTGLPGPALVMGPVTLAFGPVVALNILLLLAPPLTAWAAYLVCRRVTGSFWPSLAGGYLFGFSTYEVAQMHGHLNLVLIFPVPLAVYLVLRRLDGTIGRARFVLLLALVLVGEFSISTEVFATMTLFAGVALLGAVLLGRRELRRPLVATTGLIGLSYLIAGVVLSPYLYYALTNIPPGTLRDPQQGSADLLSFVVPRFSTWVGGEHFRSFTRPFLATVVEDGAYVGIPLLLVLVHFAISQWRRRATWLLLAFVGIAAVASLGPVLYIHGRPSISLPWRALVRIPLIRNALPGRFTAYMWLGIGVIAARWLAGPSRWGWARWGVLATGAAMMLPVVSSPPYHPSVDVPEFFADGIYRRYVAPGEIILPIPDQAAEEMLWQAEAGMYFRLARGYVGLPPKALSGGARLNINYPRLIHPGQLQRFLTAHHVGVVVVEDAEAARWRTLLASLGVKPLDAAGVTLYPIRAEPGLPVQLARASGAGFVTALGRSFGPMNRRLSATVRREA